jgi:hypothetical protein
VVDVTSWIDELPELMTPLDADEPKAWSAHVDGQELRVRRLDLPPSLAAEVAERLRSLHEGSAGREVVGAVGRPDGMWLLLKEAPSVTLRELLAGRRPALEERIALALDLLEELERLQRAGLGVPRLDEGRLRVGADGRLRVAEPWHLPAWGEEPAAEVRRTAAQICELLQLPRRRDARLSHTERRAPALAVTARALASGSQPDAAAARQALEEAAGWRGGRAALARCRAAIGDWVARRTGVTTADRRHGEAPAPPAHRHRPWPNGGASAGAAAAGLATAGHAVSATGQTAVARLASAREAAAAWWRRGARPASPSIGPKTGWRAWLTGSAWRVRPQQVTHSPAVLALVAVVGLIVLFGSQLVPQTPPIAQGSRAQRTGAAPIVARTPAAETPAPTPSASPTAAPTSAGDVAGVKLSPVGSCEPGSACSLRVDVGLRPLPADTDVRWIFKVTDVCAGRTVESPGSSVSAEAGWTYLYGISSLSVPASRSLQVVAETTSPATADSAPLTLGGSSC